MSQMKILVIVSIISWAMNAGFMGYVSYRLFGAGFICVPEGLPVESEAKEP